MEKIIDSKFIPFDFKSGIPSISITENGVLFNRTVIQLLKKPKYAVLKIDANNELIAIQSCKDTTDYAYPFYTNDKANCVRWNSKNLLYKICEITGWNLDGMIYKINGRFIANESAILFNLNNAEMK